MGRMGSLNYLNGTSYGEQTPIFELSGAFLSSGLTLVRKFRKSKLQTIGYFEKEQAKHAEQAEILFKQANEFF